MASLLSRVTAMPVTEAKNNIALQPNCIYVIPPNKLMVVSRRRLKLSPRLESRETNAPIDHFLKSLAREEGNRAIGVILSGSGGTDGTAGCLDIKSEGGITFAQDDKSARWAPRYARGGHRDRLRRFRSASGQNSTRTPAPVGASLHVCPEGDHQEPLKPIEEQGV